MRKLQALRHLLQLHPHHRASHSLLGRRFLHSSSSSRRDTEEEQLLAPLAPHLVAIMDQRISSIRHRHSSLLSQLNSPAASPEDYSSANKELRKLASTIDLINSLHAKNQEINELQLMASNPQEDNDLRHMATDELNQALKQHNTLQHKLFKSLLPKDDADERGCILEVRAGTGGEEASLFAMDIFKMYNNNYSFSFSQHNLTPHPSITI